MSCSEENLAVGGASFLIICLGTSDGVRPLLLLRSCFVRGAQSTLKDLNLDTSASWLKRMQTSPLTFYTAGASELLLRLESFLFLNSDPPCCVPGSVLCLNSDPPCCVSRLWGPNPASPPAPQTMTGWTRPIRRRAPSTW